MHYRVTHETNRAVKPGELLLVDSGGQYLDGTTDITRTLTVGPPPEGAAEAFTRVLQGMIAMSRIRWPKGRVAWRERRGKPRSSAPPTSTASSMVQITVPSGRA